MGRGKLQLATRGGDQPTHENSRRRDGLFLRQPTSVIAGLWIPELRPTCCFFDCTGLPVNHHCEVARSYREFCVPTGTRTHTHIVFSPFLLFSFSLSLYISLSICIYKDRQTYIDKNIVHIRYTVYIYFRLSKSSCYETPAS